MEVFRGMHRGPFGVRDSRLLIRGMIYGDLVIEGASHVELRGMLFGKLILLAGKVRLSGIANGNITNEGGVLEITGIVRGRIAAQAAATCISSRALCSP